MKKLITTMLLLTNLLFPLSYQYNGQKLTLDDKKIEKAFQIGINNFNQQYGDIVDAEELKLLIFNNVMEQELMLQAAKDFKVKVSSKEVEEQMKQIEGQFPNLPSFERALQAQGFSKASLKVEIENNLKLTKVKEAIESQVVVTEEEIKTYFEENKFNSYLVDKTYDSIKKDIKDSILNKKQGEALRSFVERALKTTTFPKINKQENPYKVYQMATVYEKEGFQFTNVDLANRKINYKIEGIDDEEALERMAKESIDKELILVVKARELGLKVDETLAKEDQISAYREAYQKHLLTIIKLSDDELKEFFEGDSSRYDRAENYDFDLIELEVKVSAEDEAAVKEEVEGILKEALVEGADFEALAQKYSEDSSAASGGSLGWFGKGQMVEEFETAVFAGEKGKVIPNVVRTEFGYHVVKVDDKKAYDSEVSASHIIVTFKAGKTSIEAIKTKANTIVADIKDGKTTFEAAAKEFSLMPEKFEFRNIKKGDFIQGIGQDLELSKALESSKLDEIVTVVTDRAFILKKIKHSPFIKAEFTEVKDRVNYDLIRVKVAEEMAKLFN